MPPNSTPTDPSPAAALADVLAGYLLTAPAFRWPGTDGLLVEDVLREYPAAAAAWVVPGEVELCERHPELAPQIVAFFFRLTVAP